MDIPVAAEPFRAFDGVVQQIGENGAQIAVIDPLLRDAPAERDMDRVLAGYS